MEKKVYNDKDGYIKTTETKKVVLRTLIVHHGQRLSMFSLVSFTVMLLNVETFYCLQCFAVR